MKDYNPERIDMKNYLKIVQEIFDEGEVKHTRTGTDIISIAGAMFKHDMADGFPLLTTKKMPIKMIASELEFFIKGITDKKWLQERRNSIWDEWCNREIVPYGTDEETLAKMAAERDLGPVYGYQWRKFGKKYQPIPIIETKFDKTINPNTNPKYPLIGQVFENTAGFKYTVIDRPVTQFDSRSRYDIKFHETGYTKTRISSHVIKGGNIKDPYSPTVFGVACLGEGEPTNSTSTRKMLYRLWNHIIDRCYNPECQEYKYYGNKGVYVQRSWLIFENFVKDIQEIPGWEDKKNNPKQYQLDKDLNGGDCYSKDNCIWITKTENLQNTSRIRYFEATSPNGTKYTDKNISEFSRQHGLTNSKVSACLNGRNDHHKQWTFKYLEQKEVVNDGVDQLKNMVHMLKTNPDKKRNLVCAWNPVDQPKMALPPCHFAYQATVLNGRLNLLWSQRSVDTALGLPFNIASYAIFLLLLAKETGYEPGKLVGFLGDTHIYVNHEEGLKEQLSREPLPLPYLKINNFTSIFDWEYTDIELKDYQSHPAIPFEIAV